MTCDCQARCELNSSKSSSWYDAARNAVKDQDLQTWLKGNVDHVWFSYVPDLFAHSLEPAVPMAQKLYDVVVSQDSSASPYELVPGLFATMFKKKTRDRRVFLYGEFLDNLKAWQ